MVDVGAVARHETLPRVAADGRDKVAFPTETHGDRRRFALDEAAAGEMAGAAVEEGREEIGDAIFVWIIIQHQVAMVN